jgi:N-acetylglucosaminyl-diphospho-decaprenol L-rhamnosyltransferase
MTPLPSLAVVVVTFNTREATLACLASLARIPAEVVVVDNASNDGTATAVRSRFPTARLIENATNLGFSVACNRGWRATVAPNVLFLNSDALLTPSAASGLVDLLAREPKVGIVGPRLVDAAGHIEVSWGRDLGLVAEFVHRRLVLGVAAGRGSALCAAQAHHSAERDVDWVSGACLVARREALEAVFGFDEGFFLYEEDADLCLRVRREGWRVRFTPVVTVTHVRGVSMARDPGLGRLSYHRSHLRYYRKHCGLASQLTLRSLLLARGLVTFLSGGRNEGRALFGLATSCREALRPRC